MGYLKCSPWYSISHTHHSLRIRALSVSCGYVLALLFVTVFIFEMNAFTAKEWSFFSHKDARSSGLDRKIVELCHSNDTNIISSAMDKLQDEEESHLITRQRIEELGEKIRDSVKFLPLKNLAFGKPQDEDQTWFMSDFDKDLEDGNGFLHFPSNSSNQRILCVKGRDTSDGTKNSYALAWREYLPPNSTLLSGLTFISREYDYVNIYHALRALGPFLYWNSMNENVKPQRLVLYGQGELVLRMGSWGSELVHAGFGYKVPVDVLDYGDRPVCFEQSVVNRHHFGRFSAGNQSKAFAIIRWKAQKFCNITQFSNLPANNEKLKAFNFTLLTRSGARSFKNESAVSSTFEDECRKVPGCAFRTVRADGLSFCEQVRLLSNTQVLVSVHGAQMTNMVFMERGSHVMEIFPKGWLEFGGQGQYVYHWLVNWADLKHEGDWRDAEGPECPNPEKGEFHCFMFFKNRQVGYNHTSLSKWSADVLRRVGISAPTANGTSR